MRSTFKILMYLKKGSEKPNGNVPLMCRLTVDGEIKQFSCKMDVPPRLWDVKTGRASGKSIEAQRINHAVDKIRVDVNRRYQEMMQTDGYVTAAKLKDAYLGIGIKQETQLKLFEQHNDEFLKKVGHSRAQVETEHKTTIDKLSEQLNKIFNHFPHIKELLRWENFLRSIGLPDDMVRRLFNKETVVGSGELYSKEHSKRFKVEDASLKLEQDKAKPENIRFTINGTDIFDWFKQKQKEFLNSLSINPKKSRGRKI